MSTSKLVKEPSRLIELCIITFIIDINQLPKKRNIFIEINLLLHYISKNVEDNNMLIDDINNPDLIITVEGNDDAKRIVYRHKE
jgi:hypothetical protein